MTVDEAKDIIDAWMRRPNSEAFRLYRMPEGEFGRMQTALWTLMQAVAYRGVPNHVVLLPTITEVPIDSAPPPGKSRVRMAVARDGHVYGVEAYARNVLELDSFELGRVIDAAADSLKVALGVKEWR